MSSFRIGVAIPIPQGAALSRDIFPHLAYAVHKIAERGQELWQGYASGAPLPNGGQITSRSGAYMRSILVRELGEFASEIFSELPYAKTIEEGAPARDLRKMLDSSLKVRISKKGLRYLIIPFRHGVPGTQGMRSVMPQAAFNLWKGLRPSRVTGQGVRPSGTGAYDIHTRKLLMVPQRKYAWGDRLKLKMLHEAGVVGKQAKRMAGMVHFQNPTGSGGGKHGTYMTFRVMSERSMGWMVPARPGLFPSKQTADQLRPLADKAMSEAVTRDIEALMEST